MSPPSRGAERLTGEVERIVFSNGANGFAVVEVADADTGRARAAGSLAGLVAGQHVQLVGRWTEHPRHGRTFRADAYEAATPRTEAGLVAFLASRRFTGVGDVLAQRLVAAFGGDLPGVIEHDPERLVVVRGVSGELAHRIARGWRAAAGTAELLRDLGAAGVPQGALELVARRCKQPAEEVLEEDPYRLVGVPGVRWAAADRFARARGAAADDPRRLAAAAAEAHRLAAAGSGHMALPRPELERAVQRLLASRDEALVAEALALVAEGTLVDEDGLWYTPEGAAAEAGLAAELARLLQASSRIDRRRADQEMPAVANLTDDQRRAVETALRVPVSVLVGGPGTGKTWTLRALVDTCRARELDVALCAPTGRAAKRIEELVGHGASTVHRLLEPRGSPEEGFSFTYGPSRRLPFDLVVADEWSMADTELAWSLCSAVDDGAHLLLVGDPDQLPSVGPGAVLRDLVAEPLAATLPVTNLRQVHRQAARSRIVTLAHEINAGSAAAPQGRDADVFAVPERPESIPARVAEIVATRAPAFFGCNPRDVQVLAPMYRGRAGVDALNAALKARLNPERGRRAVGSFHEGDRVVQTRNDAERDVANGDIGEVIAVDVDGGGLEVAFDHGVVPYEPSDVGDLAPAWCLTVHKAQGSEWPVVVLVLSDEHRAMLWRGLVYTAVTRAAQGLLLVGEPHLLAAAAARPGQGARRRCTRLTERLRAAVSGARP